MLLPGCGNEAAVALRQRRLVEPHPEGGWQAAGRVRQLSMCGLAAIELDAGHRRT
jgi:hypothetical protein